MPLKKKILFYSILAIGLLLFGRAADWFAYKYILKSDTSFYTYSPGYYAFPTKTGINVTLVNSLGIRSKEISETKEDTRIFFLGDSFTLGPGVSDRETFVAKSSELLGLRGFTTEHINGGIIAYGPSNSLGLFKHLHKKVNPDIVILSLYQNDVLDSGETALYQSMRDSLRKRGAYAVAFFIFPKISNFFLKKNITVDFQKKIMQISNPIQKIDNIPEYEKKNSVPLKSTAKPTKTFNREQLKLYLYSLLKPYEKSLDLSQNSKKVESWINNTLDFIEANNVDIVDIVQLLYGIVEPEYFVKSVDLDKEGKNYFENMIAVIVELRNEVEGAGMKFGLVYIPSEVMYNSSKQALDEKFNFILRKEWLTTKTNVELELESFTERENIPFLNLTPKYRESKDKNMTFEYDVHLNEKGHAVAAEYINLFLSEKFNLKKK